MSETKESTKVSVELKELLTAQNFEKLKNELIFTDESSAMGGMKLNVEYPIIKTSTTKVGKRVFPGSIFVPNGDEVLKDFGEELEGIVILMYREKNYYAVDTESDLPDCSTPFVPPILGRRGFRNGNCSTCSFGKFVQGDITGCMPVIKYLILAPLNGELRLLQFKAKGKGTSTAKTSWVTASQAVKGQTLSSTMRLGLQHSKFISKKDNKEYEGYFPIWKPGEKTNITPEQKAMLVELKAAMEQFIVAKFIQLEDTIAAREVSSSTLGYQAPPELTYGSNTVAPAMVEEVLDAQQEPVRTNKVTPTAEGMAPNPIPAAAPRKVAMSTDIDV